MIVKLKDAKRVRLVVYETGDKRGRYSVKESADEARDLLRAMGFKLFNRLASREYWTSKGGLRALIAPEK